MSLTREECERREVEWLAPYAMHAVASRGRQHAGPNDPFRTVYQQDRDRIIHSRAFRRLQYKTQVFTNSEGDHFRTRLTHTIEVAQLARTAARRLRLNEDLVECVALVHDVGHPPFGHRGEDLLAELMAEHGGFEHNRQGLRIVEELEIRYPDFPGLNLTYEVRESIIKHSAQYDRDRVPLRFQPKESPLLEIQLVDLVDSVVYDCHDIDDGIRGGYIGVDALSEVPLFKGGWQEAVAESPRNLPPKLLLDRALRILMDSLVGNLVEHTESQLKGERIEAVDAVRANAGGLVTVSPSMRQAKETLEAWLFENLYRHWRVNRVFHTARRVLADLFGFYVAHPDSLPPEHAARAEGAGLYRAVADYIAGMTDRFAMDEHIALFGAPRP
ncbi:MAG: deoxyguanosinetriphosphate triphosphohydrolase [Planctomycetes bacterium]|nr:deoxyguanosinetriphosphate triphosphohydrolase [Planctomycetota bacterium]